MISLFCFCLFSALIRAQNCKSIEIRQSDPAANVRQTLRPTSRDKANTIIGNKAPCGEKVCSSCIARVSFPVVTRRYHPSFALTAHRGTIAIMDKVFGDMARENNALLLRMGSRGGICCRLTRRPTGGCGSSWSLHSYGMAFDLKVDNYNDVHGDGCVHKALFDVHKFMARHGMYWGKDFRNNEDAMHWEVSSEEQDKWLRNGVPSLGNGPAVNPSPPTPPVDRCKQQFGTRANCKHVDTCRGTTVRGFCPGDKFNLCCHSESAPVAPTPSPTPRPTPRPTPAPILCTFEGARCVPNAAACPNGITRAGLCGSSSNLCCSPDTCKRVMGETASCIDGSATCAGTVESGLCANGRRCCAPPKDAPPLGMLNIISNMVTGWACDADTPGMTPDVHIYVGGPAGRLGAQGTSIGSRCGAACLNKPVPNMSPADIESCGCVGKVCNVGFAIPLKSLTGIEQFEGANVATHAYVINVGPQAGSVELKSSPRAANIAITGDSTPDAAQPPPVELPACMRPDACDSTLPCCSFCIPVIAGTVCRPSGNGGCKLDAVCDGANGYCESRERQPPGTPCDDENSCTVDDQCTLDGTCFGKPQADKPGCGCKSDSDCDDGNRCSKDMCNVSTGKCSWDVDTAAAGQECRRARALACDFAEHCTGTDIDCPPDVVGCDGRDLAGDGSDSDGGDVNLVDPPAPVSMVDSASAVAASASLIGLVQLV